MGYTHYWNNDQKTIDPVKWDIAFDEAAQLVKKCEYIYDLENVSVDQGEIWFDGECETFSIPKNPELVKFDFCKTNRYQYDDVVVGVLAILAEAGLNVSCDGFKEDYQPGLDRISQVAGRKIANPIKDDAVDNDEAA